MELYSLIASGSDDFMLGFDDAAYGICFEGGSFGGAFIFDEGAAVDSMGVNIGSLAFLARGCSFFVGVPRPF